MSEFNGRTTIPDHLWSEPNQFMQTDARLLGLDGVFHDNGCTKMFHCAIPASLSGHPICIYETSGYMHWVESVGTYTTR